MCKCELPRVALMEATLGPAPVQTPAAFGKAGVIGVEEVEQVHYLVECCMVRKLNMVQTAKALQSFGVPTKLTCVVWQQLRKENPAFFKSWEQYLDN